MTTKKMHPRCKRRPKRFYIVDGPAGTWLTTSKRGARRIITRETLGRRELVAAYTVTAYERRPA